MKRLRTLRRWFARKFGYARLVCLVLLIGIAAMRVADLAPIEELRLRVFDAYQLIAPRVKAARPVTIVDIDEKSIAKYGQFPWPRTLLAQLVTRLTQLGAVVIAFGCGVAMTAYAATSLWLVRDHAMLAFWLGLAAMFVILVVITAFTGLLVKRDIGGSVSRDGGSFSIKDTDAQPAGDTQ